MLRGKEPTRPSGHEVHLYFAKLDEIRFGIQQLWNLLSQAEKNRSSLFKREEDRERYVISRGLLRIILGRYLVRDPKILEFVTEGNGKPKIASAVADTGIQFNISHSGNLVLLGLTNGLPIGVDVEKERDDLDVERLAERIFTPHEYAEILRHAGRERYRAFFRYWTIKEAYAKGLGVGVSHAFRRFGITSVTGDNGNKWAAEDDLERAWTLFDIPAPAGYLAAAAVKDGQATLKALHFDFIL